VPCLIMSAFKTAAAELPLPDNPNFPESWCRVKILMCARLSLAFRIIKNGQTIAQLIARKRKALTKVFPDDTEERASRRRDGHDADAIVVKSEAMQYVQELLLKIETAGAPNVILSPHLPRNWNSYSKWRKRNLIQLFFWDGKHHRNLQLISDFPKTRHFRDAFIRN
jgi:hypothetical protein